MGKHLVLAGSGHAHLFILSNLEKIRRRGYEVTLISPSDFYYHPGMAPGLLGGFYRPDANRLATRRVVEQNGCRFISGYVKKCDPPQRIALLDTGETIPYDVISFSVGSRTPREILIEDGESVISVKPIDNLIHARRRLLSLIATSEKQVAVSVVGGGPSACEIAGNIYQVVKRQGEKQITIRLFAGKRMLGSFPERGQEIVRQLFSRRKIEIVENDVVTEIKRGEVILESNRRFSSDITLNASGLKPVAIFRRSGLETGPDGALQVSRFLQNEKYTEIFGGGDCICLEKGGHDKIWIDAVNQGKTLYHNVMAFMAEEPLTPFTPQGNDSIALNLGGNRGLFMGKNQIHQGYLAFMLKAYFERRFMGIFKAMK